MKTIVELDMVGYSTICNNIEQALDVHSVAQLNDQIQSFIDAGLEAVNAHREQAVIKTTGDGAILVFDIAQDAHKFSEAVHEATRNHNRSRTQPLAKRIFRIGAATGEIDMQPKPGGGFEIAGITVARAVRLEAKATPGGLLVDDTTYSRLTADEKRKYDIRVRVQGKRDEEFDAYPCQMNPNGPKDAAFFTDQKKKTEAASSLPDALALWRKKLAFLQTEEEKTADAEQKFAIQERIKDAKEKIRELGGESK